MKKLALAVMLIATPAVAIKDKDNLGRWDKRVEKGPDSDVPGFLVNLGPTVARFDRESKELLRKLSK